MFSIKNDYRGSLHLVTLTDPSNGTFAEVLPACGGILHAFSVLHNDKWLNIIDGYEGKEDFEAHVTDKGLKSCKLSPFACRINKGVYQYNDQVYTIEKFYLQENAIHGLIYDAPFAVMETYADEHRCGVVLQYRYTGSDKGYPFHFDCQVTYQLEANSKLTLSTKITNQAPVTIPVQDGWHPYFTLGGKIDDLMLEFQSAKHVVFDEGLIPTGEYKPYHEYNSLKLIGDQFFDDCFQLNMAECQPLCVLRDPAQQIQIEIRPDKSYPYMQFYTPDHRKSIAIENLSAPPDCFNSGVNLLLLPAGESAYFNTTYQVKAL